MKPGDPGKNAPWKTWNIPGVSVLTSMMQASESVRLRVLDFRPPHPGKNPPVVFVAGWITRIETWKDVLEEMTRDFRVIYIETRDKISSEVRGKVSFGVEATGKDVVHLISGLGIGDGYVLFGSSLGGTLILDTYRFLEKRPLCLVLIGPNAVFRVPRIWKTVVMLFYPPFYFVMKPIVKWYLKTFRMDVKSDRAQHDKYSRALDAADPWKLKKAAMALWNYQVWERLPGINVPALIIGASKDTLHEPGNLKRMVSMMPAAEYLDMETNLNTHSKKMVDAMRRFLSHLPETGKD